MRFTKNNPPSKELIEKISEYYYTQKLSCKVTGQSVGLKSDVVRRILVKYLNGARSAKEVGQINGEKFRGRKFSTEVIENMRKGWMRSRSTDEYKAKKALEKIGEKNPQAVLTFEIVIEIRKQYEDMLESGSKKTESQRYLGKVYGVSRSCVSDIVARRTWKHIED